MEFASDLPRLSLTVLQVSTPYIRPIASILPPRAGGRNLWVTALVLLVPGYLGFATSPWVRETQTWKNL